MYSLLVGMFVFQEIKVSDLKEVILKAAVSSAVVLFVIATSSSFSWLLTSMQIPEKVAGVMLEISKNPTVILLILNVILLFLGTFLETQAIILLVTPIIFPLAMNFGIDPLLLGIIIVVNTSVGMITPPMAVNLFVACSISGLSIERISKRILPFLFAEIAALLLITNIPAISLTLVKFFK